MKQQYKFQMFGYWAAIEVHLNRLGEFKRPNPWKQIVLNAKGQAANAGPRSPEIRKQVNRKGQEWI